MGGFFSKIFGAGKQDDYLIIKSPLAGVVVPLSEVKDEAFSQGFLGKGVAIVPSGTTLHSPVAGTVDSITDAKHAVNLSADFGAEILIHVGMDTVSLKGAPFTPKVEEGGAVAAGDVLMTFDAQAILDAGLETTTPVTIANSDDFDEIKILALGTVSVGDDLIAVKKQR